MLEVQKDRAACAVEKLVSIIVPVYKVEDYITECMESLVNQTLRNIEIILIDNGNTDKASDIIKEYSIYDERIKIIKLEQNQGMPKARNIGLDVANGEYVAFVDSDDLCDTTMYEKLYRQAKRFDADVVTCNVLRFSDNWKIGVDHHPERWYMETEWAVPITGCPEQFMEMAAWAKIAKRSYTKKFDYRFTVGSVFCEDVPACTRLFLNTNKIAVVNEALYFYRNRPGSLSNQMNRNHIDCFLWAMEQQDKILKEHNFSDELSLYYIINARFLLANHILNKVNRNDQKYFLGEIWKIFRKEHLNYIRQYENDFNAAKRIINSVENWSNNTCKI